MTSNKNYPTCEHIKRTIPSDAITKELVTSLTAGYRTLPLFEKGIYEYKYTKHYSLQRNELLKCRWAEYKNQLSTRVFAPFQFVDIRDYHFFNCKNRLVPAESVHTKTDFRNKLKPGPGFDFRGQMPIPQELLMKRGEHKKKEQTKRVSIDKKNDQKAT